MTSPPRSVRRVRNAGRGPALDLDWPQIGTLLAVLVAVWLLWSTWVVYPLKILVVLFHELSHGLAALATGGSIAGIELSPREGGLCRTRGGSEPLILGAGYLGSLAWGGAILLLAARSRADRVLTVILGLLLVGAALVWVRPFVGFGFLFALSAGVAIVAAGVYLPNDVNDFLLKTIGLTSVLYAVIDIRSDVLSRPWLRESDAAQLARMTGVPTLVWGLVWLLIAVVAAGWLVTRICRRRQPAP